MKIAIVRLSAMGDIIHSMVVLQFIRSALPDATIDWVCESAFEPILRSNPDINTVYAVTIKKAKKLRSFSLLWENIKFLRTLGPYDQIIDMQGLLKSAIVSRLIGKNIHGFSKDSIREKIAASFYKTNSKIPYHENTIVRNLTLVAEALHLPLDFELLKKPKPFIKPKLPTPDYLKRPYTVLIIGSTWPSRNYPYTQWVELALKQDKENFVIVWGSSEEFQTAKLIEQETKNVNIAPKTSLDELIAIIAGAKLVLGNDTGPTHLAWALAIPSITLFGPTPVSRVYETTINRLLKSPSIVNPYRLNKQDFSIKEIRSDAIIHLAKEVLNGAF